MAPPDSILGLVEAFKLDTDPKKVNLSVGAYRDEDNKPWVLPSIKKAEERLLVMGNTQNYLERQMEECQKQLTELAMANPTGDDADTATADGDD